MTSITEANTAPKERFDPAWIDAQVEALLGLNEAERAAFLSDPEQHLTGVPQAVRIILSQRIALRARGLHHLALAAALVPPGVRVQPSPALTRRLTLAYRVAVARDAERVGIPTMGSPRPRQRRFRRVRPSTAKGSNDPPPPPGSAEWEIAIREKAAEHCDDLEAIAALAFWADIHEQGLAVSQATLDSWADALPVRKGVAS